MDILQARKIAVGICYLLQPHCEPDRINIAGSVRRKKPEVKDLEIVCIPKQLPKVFAANLFGPSEDLAPVYELSKEFEKLVNNLGTIESGKPSGRYCKIMLPQGIKLDLFMPDPVDYFRQYAVRTGSADYSSRVIAKGWAKKGWCGTTNAGLRLQKDCKKKVYTDPQGKEHVSWECVNLDGQRPPVWNSEQEFFNWIGVAMIAPEARFFS